MFAPMIISFIFLIVVFQENTALWQTDGNDNYRECIKNTFSYQKHYLFTTVCVNVKTFAQQDLYKLIESECISGRLTGIFLYLQDL